MAFEACSKNNLIWKNNEIDKLNHQRLKPVQAEAEEKQEREDARR